MFGKSCAAEYPFLSYSTFLLIRSKKEVFWQRIPFLPRVEKKICGEVMVFSSMGLFKDRMQCPSTEEDEEWRTGVLRSGRQRVDRRGLSQVSGTAQTKE